MTGSPGAISFACTLCGSPSIIIPGTLSDEAVVTCGGCNSVIASWLSYKDFVSRSIHCEPKNARWAEPISADPIMAAR